jgi:hypothetical protein
MLSKELKKIKKIINLTELARRAGVPKSTMHQRMHIEGEFNPGHQYLIKEFLLRLSEELRDVSNGIVIVPRENLNNELLKAAHKEDE